MVKTRILVISGDSKLVRFLQKEPMGNSYQLTFTNDYGKGLISTVHQESPDLVIVDVMMPNLDGIEISLRVRTCSKAPIIILSAWETGQSSVRLFDLTAESYLSKPMDIYEVIALVECALRNNRAVPAIKPSQDRHRALSPEPCLVKTGTTLKIVCAWCGRYIGEKDGYGVKGISHGICKQCEARLEAETQNMVTEHY